MIKLVLLFTLAGILVSPTHSSLYLIDRAKAAAGKLKYLMIIPLTPLPSDTALFAADVFTDVANGLNLFSCTSSQLPSCMYIKDSNGNLDDPLLDAGGLTSILNQSMDQSMEVNPGGRRIEYFEDERFWCPATSFQDTI